MWRWSERRLACQPMPVFSIVALPSMARAGVYLIPGRAIGDQVDQADAVDDDKIRPDRRAHPPHGLDRQPHPVLIRPAPAVGAVVGMTLGTG